jgi:CRISPR-associated protein Csb2
MCCCRLSADDDLLRHYGVGASARVFRSVTPVALPEEGEAPPHRTDSPSLPTLSKGLNASLEIAGARASVVQALRHADVSASAVNSIRLQREPFDAAGARVEHFAEGTRFEKERLWHVEITFAAPLSGPLVIGDGRFLGLGVMAPLPTVPGVHMFAVESGLVQAPDSIDLARAFRRAVMARVQTVLGDTVTLPPFFTGHEINGAPARSENDPHLFFLFVPDSSRLMVISPHLVERREPKETERKHLYVLDEALSGFGELRAGYMGCLRLRASSIASDTDPLFSVSRVWESVTPYTVTRHTKKGSATEALSADLCAECYRRGLPKPVVIPGELRGIPGTGLSGAARLAFPVPVQGPLILGKNRYLGGGLFVGKSLE